MLGLGCLLLGAAVLLFHSSGPNLVHLLLANYTRSPLVVSSFFQNRQRSGHKDINVILFEPEAQSVFYNLGEEISWREVEEENGKESTLAGDESRGVLFFRSHQKLRKYFF